MEKKFTRLIASFLAFMMVAACLPLTAWAADGDSLEPENLAQGRPVYATGREVTSQGPEKAVDGDLSTHWSGSKMKNNGAGTETAADAVSWLVVDLGDNVDTVTGISMVYNLKVWPTSCKVQTAANGDVSFADYVTPDAMTMKYASDYAGTQNAMDAAGWTDIAEFSKASSDENNNVTQTVSEADLAKIPEGVRYIRVYFTGLNTNAGGTCIGVKELTVMGTRKAAEPEQPTPSPVDENAYTPEQAERDGKTVKYLSFTGGTNTSRWWDVAGAAGDTAKIQLYTASGADSSSTVALDTDGIEAGNYVINFDTGDSSRQAVMHYSDGVTNQCSAVSVVCGNNGPVHLFVFEAAAGNEYDNAFTVKAYNTTKYLSLDQALSGSQRAFKDVATTFYVTPTNAAGNDGSYYIWIALEPEAPEDYSTWAKAETEFSGTTYGEPFSTDDVDTQMFRIPAIITLDNGWLVAAADVRWAGWNDNPANLDTIVSISRDNGETWEWEVVNYFGDYVNTVQGMPGGGNPGSAAFIDPVLVQAADGKVWMAIDVTAADGKGTSGSTGFDSQDRLLVAHVPAYVGQKAPGETSLYTYYVSKAGASYAVDGETVTLYPIESSNGATDSNGVYVDAFMNLYKVENGAAAKEWCKQEGAEKAVQNNLFYKQSPWKVFPTCFIMLRSADVTDSGLEWGDPIFTNTRYAGQTQPFYGVCPGRGFVTENGRIIFPVYDNATGEKSSTIYSDDNGVTWKRGERNNVTVGSKTSESQIIRLPDGTLRMYSRNGAETITYSDSTDGGVTWSNTQWDDALSYGSNCMFSIINVAGTLKGPNDESYKDVVMISYPKGTGGPYTGTWDGNRRSNGSLRLGYISGSTSEGWTINWLDQIYTYREGRFCYSCLTQFHNLDTNEPIDKFCVLYEKNDSTNFGPAEDVDIFYMEFTVADVLGEGWYLQTTAGTECEEHSWKEGVVTIQPTCTEDGTATFRCTVCGETKTGPVSALGHDIVAYEAMEATCTQAGHNAYEVCSRCGYSTTYQTIPALGHTVAIDEAVAATCTEPGLTPGSHCPACDLVFVEQEETAPLGHDFTGAYLSDDEGHWYACSHEGCDAVTEKEDHDVVVDPAIGASYEEIGLSEGSHCSICGKVLVPQEEIPALTRPTTGGGSNVGGGSVGGGGSFAPIVPVTPNNPNTPDNPDTPDVPDTPDTPDDPFENIDDPNVPLAQIPFVDVEKDSWYAESVAYVYAQGFMKGNGDMTFTPEATLKRGMMAQVIYNIAQNPDAPVNSAFADLSGRYYIKAVSWGIANGVINGYGDNTFGGESDVTRQEMVTMLYRYAKSQNLGGKVDLSALGCFVDSDNISDWAKEAMAWAVESGLIQGRGNNDIDPQANMTRAEVAVVLTRYGRLFMA